MITLHMIYILSELDLYILTELELLWMYMKLQVTCLYTILETAKHR